MPSLAGSIIRGVNLGGWLLAEPFLTPYLFAVNTCHLNTTANEPLCWYPNQIGRPDDALLCDPTRCDPVLPVDPQPARPRKSHLPNYEHYYTPYFPLDEFELADVLRREGVDADLPRRYMSRHWDTFVTKRDLERLLAARVTHLRVPVGYWIAELDKDSPSYPDPYVRGGWEYFARLVGWIRELQPSSSSDDSSLRIWLDLHGAPGSQNGFDNSGHHSVPATCLGWAGGPDDTVRDTLRAVVRMCERLIEDDLTDVVTGIGLLNEPMPDCDVDGKLRKYYDQGLKAVREMLPPTTAVFVGDMFTAWRFQEVEFWVHKNATTADESETTKSVGTEGASTDDTRTSQITVGDELSESNRAGAESDGTDAPSLPPTSAPTASPTFLPVGDYSNTFLDTHAYQIFNEFSRAYTPRQHVAYACRHSVRDLEACCGDDGPARVVGEWSGAYDKLPSVQMERILDEIANTGYAAHVRPDATPERMAFLSTYVRAQMVAYEGAHRVRGWFYWNFKVEHPEFAEWDFLRGLDEGWMPNPLPPPDVSSYEYFGNMSCYDFVDATPTLRNKTEYDAVIHEIPEPASLTDDWGGRANDDFVLHDGHDDDSVVPLHPYTPGYVTRGRQRHYRRTHPNRVTRIQTAVGYVLLAGAVLSIGGGIASVLVWKRLWRRRRKYEAIV